MNIVVVGATGVIGKAVADALAARGHEVVRASRTSTPSVDIDTPATLAALFEQVRGVDAVVGCAGSAAWAPLAKLTDEDFARSLHSKLMGQVNLVRIAKDHLRDGGSITITTGSLGIEPEPDSAAVSLVNAGLEGFVRAAALGLPRGLRVNAVSPPWITETLRKLEMDESRGVPAAEAAKRYVAAIEGKQQGEILR